MGVILSRLSKVLWISGFCSLIAGLPVVAAGDVATNVGRQETVRIESSGEEPGSGVIVKREGDVYTVLTAAHVIGAQGCARNDSISLKTSDGKVHSVAKDEIFCSGKLPDGLATASLCEVDGSGSSGILALDLAVLRFKSADSYKVASKQGSIDRNGVHVLVSGYPNNGPDDGKLRVAKSDGPASPPPQTAASTCQGYGLRYIANTAEGMSGGGVWAENGTLIGIHGRREATRTGDIVLSSGSYSKAIPLAYWKALKNQWTLDGEVVLNGSSDRAPSLDTRDLIARARIIVNKIATGQKGESELREVQRLLLLARQSDQQQPLIPALISQSLIKQYDLTKDSSLLSQALAYANEAIDLSRKWTGSYEARFEKIRAQIHSLRGNPAKAIVDIDRRLSIAPDDVPALKDKANYHYQMGDLAGAMRVLEMASNLSPNDPSILIDRGLVYAKAGYRQQACSAWAQAGTMITDQQGFSDTAKLADLEGKERQRLSYMGAVGCR
jgi:hypothetical protein